MLVKKIKNLLTEKNEVRAQKAVGTHPEYIFMIARTIQITLDVPILIDVTACNIEEALSKGKLLQIGELLENARKNLTDLTSTSYSSTIDETELIVRKAIAEAMEKSPSNLMCIKVTEVT